MEYKLYSGVCINIANRIGVALTSNLADTLYTDELQYNVR